MGRALGTEISQKRARKGLRSDRVLIKMTVFALSFVVEMLACLVIPLRPAVGLPRDAQGPSSQRTPIEYLQANPGRGNDGAETLPS